MRLFLVCLSLMIVAQAPKIDAQTGTPTPAILELRRLSPFVTFSGGFDSNINRDSAELDSVGVVAGAGLLFRDNPRKPSLEISYHTGLHRYTATDRWNRLSHFTRVAWEREVAHDLTLENIGEISIKGSTEDRELGDQYLVMPRLEYKIDSRWRVRGYAAYRARRYAEDVGRNAHNGFVGLELRSRASRGARWDVGARLERNAARDPRREYRRWTTYVDWSNAMTRRDRLELELRVRQQRYPYRFVDVDNGPDVLRRDWRVEPTAAWVRAIGRTEFRVQYEFELRRSNDIRRGYHAHGLTFGVTERW